MAIGVRAAMYGNTYRYQQCGGGRQRLYNSTGSYAGQVAIGKVLSAIRPGVKYGGRIIFLEPIQLGKNNVSGYQARGTVIQPVQQCISG